MQVTWLGHAAVEVRSGSTSVLVDPFLTGNPRAAQTALEQTPTLILVTHAHNDHVGDAVQISRRTGAPVVTTAELAGYLETQGAVTVGANIGGTVPIGAGTVKFVPAMHSSSYQALSSIEAVGSAAGLLLRLEGVTIYFAGDTALFGDMSLIGDEVIDVAFLPIGGHFTMDPADAVRAVGLLRPALVIPYHYGTFAQIEQDADAFAVEVVARTAARCTILTPGDTFTL